MSGEEIAYTEEELEVIKNVKSITNDFKSILASEEESKMLQVKKAIKDAQMNTPIYLFDMRKEKHFYDYNDAVAYYTCYKLFILKNTILFSFAGEHKGLKAGVLEIKNTGNDNEKSYKDNYYFLEWHKIIDKYKKIKGCFTSAFAMTGRSNFRF